MPCKIGTCTQCGKPAEVKSGGGTYSHCKEHRESSRTYAADQAFQRRINGLCGVCGKEAPEKANGCFAMYCKECAKRRSNARLNRRSTVFNSRRPPYGSYLVKQDRCTYLADESDFTLSVLFPHVADKLGKEYHNANLPRTPQMEKT